jgi:hypothetical protein
MKLKQDQNIRTNQRNQGMALLLTLMVLMVLTTVMVQFQVDAALFLRSSDYRLEQQKCRYAAESGIVIASNILLEQLKSPALETVPSDTTETNDLPDPNDLLDPNGLADPNQWLDLSEPVGLEALLVLLEKEIDVGDVKVSIEIHDENAKWPMLWLIPNGSPFSQKRNSQAVKEFDELADLLQVDQNDAAAIKRLAKEIGSKVNMPPAEIFVQKVGSDKSKKKRRTRRSRRSVRRRRVSHAKRTQEAKQRKRSMVQFTQIFHEKLSEDPELFTLKKELMGKEGTLLDYLGFWGHNKLNINTAPIEVLESAYSLLGVGPEQIQAIEGYRQQQKFKKTSQLIDVIGIDRKVAERIRPISTINSDTFTIKITAQLGRTRHNVIGVVNYNRGRLETLAMINN